MQDEVKFKEYMAALGEIHDRKVSGTLAEIYWQVLEPFDDDQCENVFKRLLREAKFFPKPSEFLELLQGRRDHDGTAAWLEVLGTVKRVGCYRSVRFSDPVIHSVIQAMGGWPRFADMRVDDEKWKQKEFEKLYSVISERPGKHPEYLPGLHEIDNSNAGWKVEPEIARIGYDNKVKLIGK